MTHEQTINDLLAQFEAAQTYAEYIPLRSRCVQALDSYEYGVGVGPNRAAQWDRFERIDAGKLPMIQAEYRAIPVLSLAELCEPPVNLLDAVNQFRAEAATVPLSQAVVTDFLCALITASTSLDSVREGSGNNHLEAAE
jgi:hypothetical protein